MHCLYNQIKLFLVKFINYQSQVSFVIDDNICTTDMTVITVFNFDRYTDKIISRIEYTISADYKATWVLNTTSEDDGPRTFGFYLSATG